MQKIDPRQILQDGATDGQALSWDQVAGRWRPKTPSSGGGGSGAAWAEIGRIVPTANSVLQFTGIPAEYSELYVSIEGVNSAVGGQMTVSPMADGGTSSLLNISLQQSPTTNVRSGYVHVHKPNGKVSTVKGAVASQFSTPSAASQTETLGIVMAATRLTGLSFGFNTGADFVAATGVIILYGRI